jgi:hypothetical protein
VTDVSALAGCAALHTLNLYCCRRVTDVSALAECAALHTLILTECSRGVTDVSAWRRARRCTRSTSRNAVE